MLNLDKMIAFNVYCQILKNWYNLTLNDHISDFLGSLKNGSFCETLLLCILLPEDRLPPIVGPKFMHIRKHPQVFIF